MEPSRSDTARTRWLALTPPVKRLKRRPPPDARFPEEHRLPLRPAPPSGLRWGSVPADALPETQKGGRRNNPVSERDLRFVCNAKNLTQPDKSRAMKTGHLHVLTTDYVVMCL